LIYALFHQRARGAWIDRICPCHFRLHVRGPALSRGTRAWHMAQSRCTLAPNSASASSPMPRDPLLNTALHFIWYSYTARVGASSALGMRWEGAALAGRSGVYTCTRVQYAAKTRTTFKVPRCRLWSALPTVLRVRLLQS
jgi:hypothetical protein